MSPTSVDTNDDTDATLGAAALDAKAFTMETVLDPMDDVLLQQYNSWPIRLYVIQGGIVRFSDAQGPFGYDVPDVEAALELLVQP